MPFVSPQRGPESPLDHPPPSSESGVLYPPSTSTRLREVSQALAVMLSDSPPDRQDRIIWPLLPPQESLLQGFDMAGLGLCSH